MDHPLRPVCNEWVKKIRAALDVKKEQFGADAEEAMRFFNGPYDWLYGGDKRGVGLGVRDGEDFPEPSFRMTSNRVAEMVQLFGPSLYHKNPVRVVTPREYPELPPSFFGPPGDPTAAMLQQQVAQQALLARGQDEARATLLEAYLNFTPYELGLKDEARLAIDECIIKGMGCLWTEVYEVPVSGWRMVGSFFDSVDNLVVDPDHERLEDCKWIARRCCHPVWQVEREYNLRPGSVAGNLQSWNSGTEAAEEHARYWSARGQTADLLVYWKVYSKMGLGGRLKGVNAALRPALDAYGDYSFIVVADNVPFPLNLPTEVAETAPEAEIIRRLAWPTPFWKDGAWPFTPLVLHPVPRQVWPMSHVKPAMGELKFLNWSYSFLASRIKIAARQFIGILKSADQELKKMITHGPDLTILEIDAMHQEIGKVVQFLQQPPINTDLWTIIKEISEQFDKRTGLTELMYGTTPHQYRSASEAEVKQDALKVRPDDMNARVEEAMTEIAKKEAIAARWHLHGQDVLPVLGPAGAYFWQSLVAGADADAITRQLQYRLEAGSTRKPNRERQAANMQQAMQNLFQPLMQYAGQTGSVQQVNSLISDWAKSIDLNASGYLLTPPPPPPPSPPAAARPSGPAPKAPAP